MDIVKLWMATNRAEDIPGETEVEHFLSDDTYMVYG